MKKLLFFALLFAFGWNISAQQLYLKISGATEKESKLIDSIGYTTKHSNAKSIIDENNNFAERLTRIGFAENQIIENEKLNDSTYFFRYQLGSKTNFMHIYIGKENASLFDTKKDTLIMPFSESEAFLNTTLKKLEVKGFSMAKVKLTNLQKKKGFLLADLNITLEKQRQLNDIVINGYDKFPEGHKKNIKRLYRNKVFNQQNLEKLYNDFEKYRFVKQTKYPEILFTKDSTKVYVYLEKAKANTFDGYVGFTNDEQKKLVFSGYIDLILNNALNSGEKLSLYWKSDGQDQKTFNLGVELPYIFKSPLGLKAQLNIFKQDSTYQNTQTAIDLGYYFNYNTRLYVGYQSTESSDIQNVNTASLNDFENSFVTTNFEFLDFKNDDFLFPEKTNINLKIGVGKRNANSQTDSQFFGNFTIQHNFYLNNKNIISLKSQNYYLQSDSYIINELFRFGGINSIRGFNENSLQGNFLSSILTEYRYVLAPSIYVHTIMDYGYYQDKTGDIKDNLVGLGFGFGLLTRNGLFNIVYANGSTKQQTAKLSNSIVHISFKANF